MNKDQHPRHDELIDFAEGDLEQAEARRIESHLAVCVACRTYVKSLRGTFSALEMDRVPEPPEAYFAYLAGRARHRAGRGRRRFVLSFAPGLAAATAVVLLMWWLSGARISPVDSVDIIMADMTTGEIVETVSTDPYAASLLVGDSEDRLTEIETYLLETESIYDLLDSMSETEKENFMAYLKRSMPEDGKTSGHLTGFTRKEC
jgi:anti-sigma factor RsiW